MTAPRLPKPTVNFIHTYCGDYQDLFPEVRSFESFKNLHLGMIQGHFILDVCNEFRRFQPSKLKFLKPGTAHSRGCTKCQNLE